MWSRMDRSVAWEEGGGGSCQYFYASHERIPETRSDHIYSSNAVDIDLYWQLYRKNPLGLHWTHQGCIHHRNIIKHGLRRQIIITGIQARAVPWKYTLSGMSLRSSRIGCHWETAGNLSKTPALCRIIPVTTWYGDIILQKGMRNPPDVKFADSKTTTALLFNY